MSWVAEHLSFAALAGAALAFVLGVVSAARLPLHFRADVPRSTREERYGRGMPLSVLFGDYYTPDGRRCRRRMVACPPLAMLLLITGGGLLGSAPGAMPLVPSLLTLGGLAGIVALTVAELAHVIRRRSHAVVHELDDRGRARPPAVATTAPEQYGPQYRERCACCGYPTVRYSDPFHACVLCDWEESAEEEHARSPDEREQVLTGARQRFARDLTVNDLANPESWTRPPTERERQIKREMIAELERMRRAGTPNDPAEWARVLGLEHRLRAEQDRPD